MDLESAREVKKVDGEAKAKSIDAEFFETSAKDNAARLLSRVDEKLVLSLKSQLYFLINIGFI